MDVKICGICRVEDAAFAAASGADYIGVILAPGRGRSRTIGEAAVLFDAAVGVRRVGVFVDPAPGEVGRAVDRLSLDVVQLHGGESPEALHAVRRLGGFRIWKAARPRDRSGFLAGVEAYAGAADALLLDGWSARDVGGTGSRFPWDEIAAVRDRMPAGLSLVTAGGLDPANVAGVVARLVPDAVDVSSGVERRVGEKDPDRVRAFVEAARAAARDRANASHTAVEGS